jgi:hypothetical protein
MKLRDLTTRAARPNAELFDAPADSIRIARLSPIGARDAWPHSSDTAVEVAPFPAPATEAARRASAEPPRLRFVVERPRGVRFNSRTAEGLLAVVLSVFALVVLVAASSNGDSHHITHRGAPKLTADQQCVAAARRARAAAIAKARRDRGTDAELQDTIPAATPPACP